MIEGLFCAAPWTHFHVRQDGSVHVCCMATFGESVGNLNEQTWEEIWTGEKFQDLRRRFLLKDPETLKHCNHCLAYDKFGVGSCRHLYNSYVNSKIRLERPVIYNLDLRPSSFCNQACLICNAENSTKWAAELHRSCPRLTEQGRNNMYELVELVAPTLKNISIVGGEPFIMPETKEIIDRLGSHTKHISVFFNTNGQTLSDEILERLSRFARVSIDVSIDAVGEAAEYMRYGCKWKDIDNNLRRLLLENYNIGIHPTISVFNILRITELLSYLETLDQSRFFVSGGNVLTYPDYYRIQVLPKNLKIQVENKLKEDLKKLKTPEYQKFVEGWIREMNSSDESNLWERATEKIAEVDQRRGNSFWKINPELCN